MKFRYKNILVITGVILVAVAAFIFFNKSTQKIDFNTQVKPILNKNCISCHGGVRQKAGLSFLFRDEAMAKTESGLPAIVPGYPDSSEMIKRLTLTDPEERMPFKHDALSKNEIDILRKWIKEGAVWGNHWAYIPVAAQKIPGEGNGWAKNAIDNFIAAKQNEQHLSHSNKTGKENILRRLSLDLTGIPAAEKITQQFLNDNSDKAYENLADSLLSSPRYGEKWASMWLDLARYADSKGYERDAGRNIWQYRDWVIDAFNSDIPYDKFLTDQLAGDLYKNPADLQYIATAFHRNTPTNDEGGTENEEFRTVAVIDRVNTTWQALMGTTFGCVQCHSHPYDPFKHDEYYKFLAFFNNTRDEDTQADYPLLRKFDSADVIKLKNVNKWLVENTGVEKAIETNTFLKTLQPVIYSINCDSFINSELSDTKWLALRYNAVCRLKKVNFNNKDQLIFRYSTKYKNSSLQIHLDNPTGPLLVNINLDTTKGWFIAAADFKQTGDVHDIYLVYKNKALQNKPIENGITFDWFCFTQDLPGKGLPGYDSIKANFWQLTRANAPGTPVMMDNIADYKRTTNVFVRGNWLVKGKAVEPDVPHSLNPMPANAPKNRLGMAMWLTDKKNPLTARTIVNRLWEQLFGTGLVETLEDMGTQGAAPTHPELLDYLSYKLMYEYNWSLKKLVKEIVLSATYQQDSKTSEALQEKDPYNKYYARGPRVRLAAEQIRDQALSIAGLLSNKMYGPGVMPYQPDGIWNTPWNDDYWKKSEGENQYRRAVYTYWKRSSPYPSMVTFDGVSREVCSARRIRTNSPLQALVTLNDSVYLEAAHQLAVNIIKQDDKKDIPHQITTAYKKATGGKSINEKSIAALNKLYDKAFIKLKNKTEAMSVVCNAILNLDEVITKD